MVTPSPPRLRPRQLHRRVSYVVSSDLIEASDALPSNVGRSSLVHSLAHHLDLLDVSTTSDSIECGDESAGSDDDTGNGEGSSSPTRETEQAKLLKILNEGSSNAVDEGSTQPSRHRASVLTPEPATDAQLTSYHSPRYIRALFNEPSADRTARRHTRRRSEAASSDDEISSSSSSSSSEDEDDDETFGLVDDCPRFPQLASHVRQVAGAAISAAKSLLPNDEGTPPSDVAICWDGGRHHAHKARAAGFCYINDAVLAIMELKRPRKMVLPVEAADTRVKQDEMEGDREATQATPPPPPPPPLPLGFGARPEEIKAAAAAAAAPADDGPSRNPLKRPSLTSPSSSATSNDKARRPPASPRKRRTVLQRLDRILYLDLDLHWGDGVEEAFSSGSTTTTESSSSSSSSKPTIPSVLTLSMHNSAPGFYPPAPPLLSTSSPNHINVPLPPHLGRSTTIDRLRSTCLEPLLDAYEPQAIVVQCGVDGLAGDPCKAWNLDVGCLLRCVGGVLKWAQPQGTRQRDEDGDEKAGNPRAKVLLLGGGGYHSANAARAWACITALALGRLRLPWDEESDDEEEDDDYNYYYPPEGTLMLSTPIPLSLASWPLFTADGGDDCLDVPAALRHEAEGAKAEESDGQDGEGKDADENEDERYLREIESMFARRVEELRIARGLSGKEMVC